MFDRKKILILTERIEKNAVRSLLAKMLGEKMKNDESEDVIRTTIYEAKIVAEITKFAQWVEKCLLECYSEKILTHSVSRTTILRLMKQRLQLLTLLRTSLPKRTRPGTGSVAEPSIPEERQDEEMEVIVEQADESMEVSPAPPNQAALDRRRAKRPFQCPVCHGFFRTSMVLKLHMAKIHFWQRLLQFPRGTPSLQGPFWLCSEVPCHYVHKSRDTVAGHVATDHQVVFDIAISLFPEFKLPEQLVVTIADSDSEEEMEATSPLALLAQESVAGPSTSVPEPEPEPESQVEVITAPDDELSTTSPSSTDTESVTVWPCVTGRVVKWPCGHVYNPEEIICVECMCIQWKSEFENSKLTSVFQCYRH